MMRQESRDNVKALLDRWAEYESAGGRIADGSPPASTVAQDACIHSFEDMEIADNKRVVEIVGTAVYELDTMERNAILMHYGMMTFRVWRAEFTTLFDIAIESLFEMLKCKLSC